MYLRKNLNQTSKRLIVALVAGSFTLGLGNFASAETTEPSESYSTSNDDSNNVVVATENTVVKNRKVVAEDNGTRYRVDGGEASGNSNNNTVTVNGGTITKFLNGGHSDGTGDTNNNTIIINDGTFGNEIVPTDISSAYWVEGGWAKNGNANNNTVEINNGTFNNTIVDGGYTSIGNANYNTVNIHGGTFNIEGYYSGIYGGYVDGRGNAVGNRINIYGGKINGNIYGGYISSNGEVKDNVISIYGNPDLTNATLIAAKGTSVSSSGNAINVYTKNITAKNIGGFDTLNFYLPENTNNGDTILTLTDSATASSSDLAENGLASSADVAGTYGTDLSNTVINLNASGASNLNTGDTITLVTNANGLNVSANTIQNDGTLTQGVSLDYPVSLTPTGYNSDGNPTAFTATLGSPSGLKSQTEILNHATIDTASLLDAGTDRILEWLPPDDIEMKTQGDLNSMPTTGFDPFAGIGGSSLKIDTGNGSTLKSKNGGLNVGFARALKNRHGVFVFGPVTDYGQDYYESNLQDGTKGSGHSKYFSAGIIARQMNHGGMYYEGSLRYGRMHTNFASDNFLVHNVPTHAEYSASAPIYSGHVRVGWRNHISPQNVLDVYGIYSMNRVSGFNTTLSTGDHYNFSAVNSGRLRIGARLTRSKGELQRFYAGLAFIHEFTGETTGRYREFETKKSGLKGSSGLIELGWQIKPSEKAVTMLDVSLNGWIGNQKGLQLQAKFKRAF